MIIIIKFTFIILYIPESTSLEVSKETKLHKEKRKKKHLRFKNHTHTIDLLGIWCSRVAMGTMLDSHGATPHQNLVKSYPFYH